MRKRKQILTHRSLQFRLAGVFVLWSFVLVVAVTTLFVMNYAHLSETSDALPSAEQLFTKLLLIQQLEGMAVRYFIALAFFVTLMALHIIILSHRMTGPVAKMTRLLNQAAETGEWPQQVKFRKRDAFPELASAFNRFSERMKK